MTDDIEKEVYAAQWAMTFNKVETRLVYMPDPTEKGGLRPVYMPVRQYEVLKKASERTNRLEALVRVMQQKENEKEGKVYSARPVLSGSHTDRYKIHEEFRAFAMQVFREAGYKVTALHRSPFDFVAQRVGKKEEEGKTYYVLAKCGKLTRRASLSQRQLRRMKDQYLNPRFGTENVTKLYWYACTTDKSHRTYKVGIHGGFGMEPVPHPIPEFAEWTPPVVHKKGSYACKPMF